MRWYQQAMVSLLAGEVDLDNGMQWSLHAAAYVPAATDDYFNDASNELTTGGGYTAGGLAAGALTYTKTVANSWGVTRANSTAYALDDVFKPAVANTFLYRVVTAGTSAGAPPTFPTVVGQTVADGTAVIECVGSAIIVISGTDPSWATFTAGPFQVVVLRDNTTGVASTSALLGYQVLGAPVTGGGGSFTFTKHPTLGFLHIFIP